MTTDTGQAVFVYTKTYENNQAQYHPYLPTDLEIYDNVWLIENVDDDTIYIIHRKLSSFSSFSLANDHEIYQIKKNENLSILRSSQHQKK